MPLVHRRAFDGSLAGWRDAARALLRHGIEPDQVDWVVAHPSDAAGADTQGSLGLLTAGQSRASGTRPGSARVSRRFLELAELVGCHRDPTRWHLLYSVLWRLAGREPHVLELATDPQVHRLLTMERAVRRAAHKMKAFVRFRALPPAAGADVDEDSVYVAWFEPAHDVVAFTAPFFARRFASMRWSILTPDRCVHWDRTALHFTPGLTRADAPRDDALESLWRTYYAHTFNPARLRVPMMQSEMPKQYWHLLPEASLIADLVRSAPRRVDAMIAQVAAPPEAIPASLSAAADVDVRRRPEGVNLRRVESSRPPSHPLRAPGGDALDYTPSALMHPGRADPIHDPGTSEALRRARLVEGRVMAECASGIRLGDARVSVGVAGWTDPTILQGEVFYPASARTAEARLRHYATRFSMVEGDSGYYALPTPEMTSRWVERTPDGFSFDIKAHALMTGHPADVSRLPDWITRALPPSLRAARHIYARHLPPDVLDEVWARFLAAVEPLRQSAKLGAVFLQYPRWFTPSRSAADHLAESRARLGDVPGAVEFRQRAWMEGPMAGRTIGLLGRLRLAYTVVDAPPGMESSMPPTVAVTAPHLAVVRLHGRRVATWERRTARVTERYRYLYDRDELASWVPRILDIAKQHQRVHVVFNNNHANYATTNALELSDMLLDA